jgi:asparagine synthase (glutamine-hydrolysing)
MCGIFGYFNRQQQSLTPEVLRVIGQAIAHRGPDDQGIYSTQGAALGNQRLSVIDLQGGHQPFISDDGTIVVVQNGEIFNHIELAQSLAHTPYACRTHSDTEVLLRLYESEGIGFVSKLNGMFAIAIYDARQAQDPILHLVRDRIGVKPLYVHDDGLQLCFASEIKSILKALPQTPTMDHEALHHYFSFNYVPAPHTLYRGVRHLMPGQRMRITRQGTSTHTWWSLSAVQPLQGRSEAEWIDEFNVTLDDAVRLRLRSDVPFGAFLSGGVDSSTIVGLMARHMNEPVKTFCIGFDDPQYDESAFAQDASERFRTQHTLERVDPDMLALWPLATYHCDQPHGDISFLPTYRVASLAAKKVKVVLTGDGGDELFAGYDKHQQFFDRPDAYSLSRTAFRKNYFQSISLFSDTAKAALYSPAMQKQIMGVDSFDVARPYFEAVSHQDRINQALYLDMQLLLCGNNLVKPDRMGMAVSLEARTPFLDYRMMELAFRMPGELKLKNGETKSIYKKAVAPLIGKPLAYRRKQMFTVPVGDWFRTHKARYCHEHIEALLAKTDILNPSTTRALLTDHQAGRCNNTRELRAVLSLSHWVNGQDQSPEHSPR